MVKVLMVEDDKRYAKEIAAEVLSQFGEELDARFATDVQTALSAVEEDPPDLILLDMICPLTPADVAANKPAPDAGERVVAHVTRNFPWVKIAILSGQQKEKAITLLFHNRGITDYIFKDSPYDEIRVRILKQLENIRIHKAQQQGDGRTLVGDSPPMLALKRMLERVAPEPVSVLILGETGTGKELVAREIHQLSRRRGGPFVKVNCAAFAESVLESELFGHKKGSFTGAVADRIGRFEAADGGTLFLDEVGECSETIQVKLLRFLQEREFEPVGSNRTVRVDVRLICATNRDLAQMVQSGKFREDFYHRISVIPVDVPALRDRRADLPMLARHVLARQARDRVRPVTKIAADAMAALQAYAWPGNVRELENVLARAAILAEGDEVRAGDLLLPDRDAAEDDAPADAPEPADAGEDAPIADLAHLTALPAEGGSLRDMMAQFERNVLLRAMDRTRYDVQQAAQLLGIDKRTLHNKLNVHRISRRRKRFE